MDRKAVSVIIAAYNAAATVGLAVRSAIAEPETGEVVVVDDCSSDNTAETACRAAAGDPRVKVLRQEQNRGPSAARNRAIDAATMPFIAVLDADDRFLPGRFARLFSKTDWDFCADNIAFTADRIEFASMANDCTSIGRTGLLDLETFLVGNRNSSRVDRNELGFLKPVIRRDFLVGHGLRYSETCRLGEDFLLYSKSLALGARFRVFEACGYAAFERANSLSGMHGIEELRNFYNGLELLEPDISGSAERAFAQLQDSLRRKINHREVLDIRRKKGLAKGVLELTKRPKAVRDILRDKLKNREPNANGRRVLIPTSDFDRIAV